MTAEHPRTRSPLATLGFWSVIALLIAIFVRYGLVSSFDFRLFTDRELARGAVFFDHPFATGSEMTGHGARLPGALLGLLFAVPQALSPDPHGVWLLQFTLVGLAAATLAISTRETLGPVAALIAGWLSVTTFAADNTINVLWNPGFLPLPATIATVGLVRLFGQGRADGLDLLALGTALGVQVHASALGLAVAAIPALIWRAPVGLRQRLPLAAGIVLLVLSPYLVEEALHDGQNTASWWGPGSEGGGPGWRPRMVFGHLAFLLALPDLAYPGRTGPVVDIVARVPLLICAGLVVRGLRDRTGADPRAAMVGGLGLTVATYLFSLGWIDTPEPVPRYLTAVSPAFAIIAVAPLAALLDRSRSNLRTAAGVGVSALAWLLVLAAWGKVGTHYVHPLPQGWASWRAAEARLAQARDHLHWTLEDQVRATVWVTAYGSGNLDYGLGPGLAAPLHHAGVQFKGSAPPPCALLLIPDQPQQRRPLPADDAVLAEVVPGASLIEAYPLDAGGRLLVYDTGAARCPTTLIQRYVDLPVEAELRALPAPPGCLAALPLPAPTGTTRVATRLPGTPDDPRCMGGASATVAIDLGREGHNGTFTLHSAQLRGFADNAGWYSSISVHRPRLRLTSTTTGEVLDVLLEDGQVGGMGAATPLTVTAPLPAGAWQVDLLVELPQRQPTELGHRPTPPYQELRIPLLQSWNP